ncbi:Putative aminoacrylate hydrolase RutD, partial [Tolypocladium paradoxum]
EALPSPASTPRCGPPPDGAGAEYRLFDSNFQRFQAQELAKRRADGAFTLHGFLCQLVAAGWHCKSAAQLRDMADAVGRDRILVMHGTGDNMIAVENGEKLIEIIEPGVGLVVEGMGHAPIMERAVWFNELLEERLRVWSKL